MKKHVIILILAAPMALWAQQPPAPPKAPVVPANRPALPPSVVPLPVTQRERIALVGGAAGDLMSRHGDFETLLHSRFPKNELVVRNFCRPADEVGTRQKPSNYSALDDPLAVFSPDTFVCFFGYNESFKGPNGVADFKATYAKYLDEMAKTYARPSTQAAPRFLLVTPTAYEPTGNPFLPLGKQENENLRLYAQAVLDLAKERNLASVDLFTPTLAFFSQKTGAQFTTDGAILNAAGSRETALALDLGLFQYPNPAKPGSPSYERLRAAVCDKTWVHAQDYRMLNGWYVYGGRRTWDKETFPREYVKIRNMVEVRDKVTWEIAQGREAKPDDSKTGELFVPKTMYGTQPKKEPPQLVYPTPEESIKTMRVPPGFEVQLVASEKDSPLANVNQINIDNKGRVWASCMATYPQWKPGDPRPNDRLVILDDIDPKTGRAGKTTVFYDKLICPTGFEFWKGGVIVVDEPRLIWLKDTDGDDKADVVEELSDGWATDDTHHTIGAFEWSPGGLLHMLEGVSLSTTVETPWGPIRRNGQAGCYVLDPLTKKIRHFQTPGYGNPWCYSFNPWGQGIVGDGTTPQQHWDTPLSGAPISGRKGLNTVFNGEGMRPNVGTEFIYTRQFPDEWQGAFIFACVINMNGMTTFSLGDDGAGFKGARRTKMVDGKKVPDDLISAENNMTFRPTDPQIGADGALYFGDWCAALIGHMQYSQRDPNRDHSHGRVFRLVYKDKPLLKPVTQFGKSVPELLEQFREYEPRTRYRVRRELRDRPTSEVLAAIKTWTASIPASDKERDRLLLEALWVQQGHHAVDTDLLRQVLRAKTGEARAAATRVLADEWDRIPEALKLIAPQTEDEFPRVRCEAIRALSFVPSREAVETVLLAANHPRDYWIDYTLNATLTALEPVWKPALKAGAIAQSNPKGLELLQEVEGASKPGGAAVAALKKFMAAPDMPEKDRAKVIAEIAKAKGNADNGKAVYRRVCVACHKWGGEGLEYGPAFDSVGTRLTRDDIIESILEPNAKIAKEFVTNNITTKAGQAYTGFVTAETKDSLSLRAVGGVVVELKKADIAKRDLIKQSSMPEGLANGMSPGEFLDLVEFLASQKAPAKK